MEFPVDITFKMLGWYANVHLTDRNGRMIGFLPPAGKGLLHLPVYADQSLGAPIYTIRAEHMFTHWLEDAAGRRIGEWGITPAGGMGGGKFVIIAGEPRFFFASESDWVDFADRLIPSLPVLNGLIGLFVRPRTYAVRTDSGGNALLIVKQRMMVDIRYRLYTLENIGARELECLILSALVYVLMDHNFRNT